MAAVRGRPKPKTVEDFISDGGDSPVTLVEPEVKPAESKPTTEEKALKLRLPADLLQEVDAAVKSRKPSPSRHQWILEAIYEKLEREKPQEAE